MGFFFLRPRNFSPCLTQKNTLSHFGLLRFLTSGRSRTMNLRFSCQNINVDHSQRFADFFSRPLLIFASVLFSFATWRTDRLRADCAKRKIHSPYRVFLPFTVTFYWIRKTREVSRFGFTCQSRSGFQWKQREFPANVLPSHRASSCSSVAILVQQYVFIM